MSYNNNKSKLYFIFPYSDKTPMTSMNSKLCSKVEKWKIIETRIIHHRRTIFLFIFKVEQSRPEGK